MKIPLVVVMVLTRYSLLQYVKYYFNLSHPKSLTIVNFIIILISLFLLFYLYLSSLDIYFKILIILYDYNNYFAFDREGWF